MTLDVAEYIQKMFDEDRYLGMQVILYSKGGDGPEGVMAEYFSDLDAIKDPASKLRKLADILEKGSPSFDRAEPCV